MLVMSIGVRDAARKLELNENTVLDWSRKGKWLADCRPTPAKAPPPASMASPIGPIKPADALQSILSEDERETRLSLSKAARRMAKTAEDAPLEQAGDALQAGKLASLVHRWEKDRDGDRVSLAFFSISIGSGEPEAPTVDVEGEVMRDDTQAE